MEAHLGKGPPKCPCTRLAQAQDYSCRFRSHNCSLLRLSVMVSLRGKLCKCVCSSGGGYERVCFEIPFSFFRKSFRSKILKLTPLFALLYSATDLGAIWGELAPKFVRTILSSEQFTTVGRMKIPLLSGRPVDEEAQFFKEFGLFAGKLLLQNQECDREYVFPAFLLTNLAPSSRRFSTWFTAFLGTLSSSSAFGKLMESRRNCRVHCWKTSSTPYSTFTKIRLTFHFKATRQSNLSSTSFGLLYHRRTSTRSSLRTLIPFSISPRIGFVHSSRLFFTPSVD